MNPHSLARRIVSFVLRHSFAIPTSSFLLAGFAASAADDFKPTPDHQFNPAVPHGRVIEHKDWQSKVFTNTIRDWWVYVPAQYSADKPASVMVFQDGRGYASTNGPWRAPIVFDNLIARGEMPVTIGIFIQPGDNRAPGTPPRKDKSGKAAGASNRSFEYDSLGDRYARMLVEEILPEVEKDFRLSKNPDDRAICGASSGGICAFTVAWERPDQFRKVLSTIGSFVHLRGGFDYQALIRKTERKPLRVYLADTSGDLDNPFGHWPTANRAMHASLKYMGYDVKFEWAEGYGHNPNHGGSHFPDALRWLWRKETHKPEINTKQDLGGDMTLHRLLVEGEGWRVVADNIAFADGLTPDAEGNLWFAEMRSTPPAVWKVSPGGAKTKMIEGTSCSGLKFGPDGRLYACVGKDKQLVSFELPSGKKTVVAEDVQPNDLVVSHKGHIYFTETGKKQVTFVNAKTGEKRAADTGITAPNGITLSPDQGTLAVSDYRGQFTWVFRIEADGSLSAKEPYMTMRMPVDPKGEWKFNEPPPKSAASAGDGMVSDSLGRYYVTSALGVQVFDPTGRMCGVLPNPGDKGMTSVTIAGDKLEWLYVACGDRIFRRKVQATGNLFFKSPVAEAPAKKK